VAWDRPILVLMHHLPFVTAIRQMDLAELAFDFRPEAAPLRFGPPGYQLY
jgi:hypothetical protein